MKLQKFKDVRSFNIRCKWNRNVSSFSIADNPSALPSPASSPSCAVTLLACSCVASLCIPALVLLLHFSRYGTVRFKMLSLFFIFFFTHNLCEKYYKPLAVLYSVLSWILQARILEWVFQYSPSFLQGIVYYTANCV